MKILLDIDDTSLLTNDSGKTWSVHPMLSQLISEHHVVLYSGNPDIAYYAKEWKAHGYISKGQPTHPKADVLIDNDYPLWKGMVDVKKCYKSINSFMKAQKTIK